MKLSVKAVALAGGIMWGAVLFVWTLILALTSLTWGAPMLDMLVGFYPYYDLTVTGAFVGLVAGFVDAFICGAVFALLYNFFAKSQ